MRKLISIIVVAISFLHIASAQNQAKQTGFNAITIDALQAQTGFLASEWTEGRNTGEKGEYMSADYIASMLQLYGIKPGGDFERAYDPATRRQTRKQSYFQNFSLMTTSPGDAQSLSAVINEDGVLKSIQLEENADFIMSPSYPSGSLTAPIIFVGYGYKDSKIGYNDFKDINVKGKIILRLAGIPSTDSGEPVGYAAYRAAMAKDVIAYELGAAGILEVDPSNIDGSAWTASPDFLITSPSERGTRRARVRMSIPGSTIGKFAPLASVSARVANKLLTGSGLDILKYKKGQSLKAIKGFNTNVTISTSIKTEYIKVRNVVGMIEGKNKDEVIVLGAHYDHLGIRDGYIYNGADDNASGTVGVMTIARAFAASGEKPEKTIVFALWTGEEKGLLGSRYFVANPTVPFESIKMNVNFDMISRYISDDTPNKVTMTYTSWCPEFKDITLKNLETFNIKLSPDYQPSDDPPGGSDHRSFTAVKIPIMRFKPGHREEYHSPADEVSTLDWDIMQKIIQISYLNVYDLAYSDWKENK